MIAAPRPERDSPPPVTIAFGESNRMLILSSPANYDRLFSAMSNITSDHVEIKVEDGTTMLAWYSRPAGQSAKRGIMVFPEIFGVNEHMRDVTNRYAALGFNAISP